MRLAAPPALRRASGPCPAGRVRRAFACVACAAPRLEGRPGATPCFPKTCCPPPVPDGLVPAGNPAVRLSDARLSVSAPFQAGTPVSDGLIRKPSPICRTAPIRRAPKGGGRTPPVEFLRCPHSPGGKGGGRAPPVYTRYALEGGAHALSAERGGLWAFAGPCSESGGALTGHASWPCLRGVSWRTARLWSRPPPLVLPAQGIPRYVSPRHASRGVFHTGVRRGRIGARRAGRASHGREGAR